MNVWDYFDREGKKARRAYGNLTEKVAKATGKYNCAVAPRFYPLFQASQKEQLQKFVPNLKQKVVFHRH